SVTSLSCFLPYNLPTRNGRVLFLNIAEDQAIVLQVVWTNLARAYVAGIGSHFRKMNNLLVLHINLVTSTVSERAVGGGNLFLRRCVHRIRPFHTIRIH